MGARTLAVLVTLGCLVAGGHEAVAAPAPVPSDGPAVGGDRMASRGLVVPPRSRPLPAGLSPRGWVLADLDTGAVLAARNPHGRYAPASTLKTLTALTLLPLLTNRRQVVVCTAADVRIDGSKVGLVPKGRYTVDLLFQTMLMASGNDAANALARAAGGTARTVALMNEQARALQAYDTRAASPAGLDASGQASSAYDLALISRAALRRPDFRAYVAKRRGRVPAQLARYHSFEFANHNRLLGSYPGAFGVKTGYTDAARHTYVGAAARRGRRLVVTFLHAEHRPAHLTRQAAALLDWGFALPRTVAPVGQLVDPIDPATGTTASPAPSTPPPAAASAAAVAPAGRSGGDGPPVSPLLGGAAAVAGFGVLVAGALRLRRRTRSRRRWLS